MSIYDNIFGLLAGFGLFVLSLRFLYQSLDHFLTEHLRRWLNHMFNNTSSTLWAGLSMTALFQSRHIVMRTTMGLLHHQLISLDHALLLIIGSALGTTFKAFIFAADIQAYLGFVLIASGALVRMMFKHHSWKKPMNIPILIGFYFLSLELISQYIPMLINAPGLASLPQGELTSLSSQGFLVAVGCGLGMFFRSSSLSVFLVIQLALLQQLNYLTGVSLILGLNLGVTLPSFWTALRYQRVVWRLSLAWIGMTSLGVLITMFFFPYFTFALDALIPGAANGKNLAYHLALVHVAFNAINALWWYVLAAPYLRLIKRLFPNEEPLPTPILSPVVREMLSNSSSYALQETQLQMKSLLQLCKEDTDNCFYALLKSPQNINQMDQKYQLSFELLKEGNYELLLRMKCKNNLSEHESEITKQHLKSLSQSGHLFQITQDFQSHLEKGYLAHGYYHPNAFKEDLERFQESYNALWLGILLGRSPESGPEKLELQLEALEKNYFDFIQTQKESSPRFLSWLYQNMIYLKSMTHQLSLLYQSTLV